MVSERAGVSRGAQAAPLPDQERPGRRGGDPPDRDPGLGPGGCGGPAAAGQAPHGRHHRDAGRPLRLPGVHRGAGVCG
ncbi:hypothetical protein [Nocardioides convexus]|uniref:hypothetical protein n=1 Tax=Nocardioides convexus TaxID=2712224 RepID=UPI002418ADB8|nr:hypothetical protein [Nocardioides convexus]